MIKFIATLSFVVYLVVLFNRPGTGSAGGGAIAGILSVVFGFFPAFGFTLPSNFFDGVWNSIAAPLPQSPAGLAAQMEMLSTLIRQDGLLALESKRKEIRDSDLRYFLKRILDGFESKDLVPLIETRMRTRREHLDSAEQALLRGASWLPVFGLIPSLLLVSGAGAGFGLSLCFLPFIVVLLLQWFFESSITAKIHHWRMDSEIYHLILKEGVAGIQEGKNPEILRDRIRAIAGRPDAWAGS
jgi:flagellar motor component MotA